MYKTIKKLLFFLPPETAHQFSMLLLRKTPAHWFPKIPDKPVDILGLRFANPIGLAAGFDKNGDHIDNLAKLGFGFIEVGTVTPKPQEGNPKPRLFRLSSKKALINRMGFNNKGIDYVIERLKERKYKGIVGVNIGKNASTSLDEAVEDYLICVKKVYPYADYITINISSPNTPYLRQLQQNGYLNRLLLAISTIRMLLSNETGLYKPLLLKISPDETDETLEAIVDAVLRHKIDGIIATNTTVDKSEVQSLPHANEAGGMSGPPLFKSANQTLKTLNNILNTLPDDKKNLVALIGVGGIMKPVDVKTKFMTGAKLVQVYTGLIYQGPFWIKRLLKAVEQVSN